MTPYGLSDAAEFRPQRNDGHRIHRPEPQQVQLKGNDVSIASGPDGRSEKIPEVQHRLFAHDASLTPEYP